jgi:hypothetical protein
VYAGHKCTSLQDASTAGRVKCEEMVQSLRNDIACITPPEQSTLEKLHSFGSRYEEVQAQINQYIDGLISSLETRRTQLHDGLDTLYKTQRFDMNEHYCKLHLMRESMEQLLIQCGQLADMMGGGNEANFLLGLLDRRARWKALQETYQAMRKALTPDLTYTGYLFIYISREKECYLVSLRSTR